MTGNTLLVADVDSADIMVFHVASMVGAERCWGQCGCHAVQ